jgi:hypothetical protein
MKKACPACAGHAFQNQGKQKGRVKPAFRHPLRFDASTSVVKEKADIAARLILKG